VPDHRPRPRVLVAAAAGAAAVAAGIGVATAWDGGEEPPGPAAAAAAPPPATAPRTTPAPAPPARRSTARASTVRVPGGGYTIGSTAAADEQPVHRIRLAPFRIDRFEVTNARYVRYLNALGVRPRADAEPGEVDADTFSPGDARLFVEGGEGEERDPLIALDDEHARIGVRGGRFFTPGAWADHPVTEVTWEGARRFAAWAGGRLPTEVEWEAAARGRDGRTYPWGDAAPSARRAVSGRGSGETLPVGSRPDGVGPGGIHDMAGNVDEWTSSLHRAYPYRRSTHEGRGAAEEERVTRGGNHVYSAGNELRSAYRLGFSREPDRGHRHIGFRVAYDVGG